jgi:hypothetical protein
VLAAIVKNVTNINKRMFVAVPSQYRNFYRYMCWSLLWSVMLRSEVIALLILMELLAIMA